MIAHALTAAAVLSHVRAATLARPISSIVSIHTKGTIRAVGLRGTIDEWDDTRRGRFVQRVVGTAALGSTDGWSGRVEWHREPSGITRIDGGFSTTVPISIVNNHIYVHVTLDGKGPYTFIFDTGGTYILTPAVAIDGMIGYDVPTRFLTTMRDYV